MTSLHHNADLATEYLSAEKVNAEQFFLALRPLRAAAAAGDDFRLDEAAHKLWSAMDAVDAAPMTTAIGMRAAKAAAILASLEIECAGPEGWPWIRTAEDHLAQIATRSSAD